MSALAGEPRGETAKLVVMLEQQHAVAGLREDIRPRKPAQAASDDNDVILVGHAFEPVISHGRSKSERTPCAAARGFSLIVLPPVSLRRKLSFVEGTTASLPAAVAPACGLSKASRVINRS